MTKGLDDFKKADIRPKGPSKPGGYNISTTHPTQDDEVRYILRPDREFRRPWVATPGGSAYVWPGGVEGFQLTSNAETGIHKYLGEIGTDVIVVYPDEFHISLSGTFPGKTSVANLHALRSVLLQQTIYGHILALPGIQSQLLYVVPINHQFAHDPGDYTSNVNYSVEFIKTGTGSNYKLPPLHLPQSNPTVKTSARGKNQRHVTTKHGFQTLRAIANQVYHDVSQEAILMLASKNASALKKHNISLQKSVTAKLPVGMRINW